eukprot:c21066_g1_i1.p1 GENE.c21066_g1_i1~~c21066_g1_i1.p1  ORF type:complete len:464 (-),score=102.95 c21066_g1_i1:20-1411(-)
MAVLVVLLTALALQVGQCVPIAGGIPEIIPHVVIPCETPGNTTACNPPPEQVLSEEVPEAEVMPPIPPVVVPGLQRKQDAELSIEFVDLGLSKQIHAFVGEKVWDIVVRAGEEFGLKRTNIQLIRNAGIDVEPPLTLENAEDQLEVIVYLTCIQANSRNLLITQIPTCESLEVRNLTALVELPSDGRVFEVSVESTRHVSDIFEQVPLNANSIKKITYDGSEVFSNTSLESIQFRDRSAFIVYEKFPCPSHSPSPTASPSPSPSASKIEPPEVMEPQVVAQSPLPVVPKKRKLGASDVYRHCSTSRGGGNALPPPDALGLDAEAVDPSNRAGDPDIKCEESEMTEPETRAPVQLSPPLDPPPAKKINQRGPMVEDAIIYAMVNKRSIPVHVTPASKGVDIFDAVTRATGIDHKYMVGEFLGVGFDHYTALKPLGLIDGDVVQVSHPHMPEEVEEKGADYPDND